MNGTIKTLPEGKPFGFIAPEGEAQDVFFHESEVKNPTFAELKVGDAVTFEVVEKVSEKDGSIRKSAANVVRA